jgi:Tol biopolymer transport system component
LSTTLAQGCRFAGPLVKPASGASCAAVARIAVALLAGTFLAGCAGSSEAEEGAIAFTVSRGGFGEIWVMGSDGVNAQRLTEPGAETDASGNRNPAWSPDGTRIAYVGTGDAVEEDARDQEIYVMQADGSEPVRLTNDRLPDSMPAWSPDGERIAFSTSGPLGGGGVIVTTDAAGQERAEVTRPPETCNVVVDTQPAWSPDGTLIAFTRITYGIAGESRTDIYTIAPTGVGERLLIEDAADPAWSPEGDRIAFTTVRDLFGLTCFHECTAATEIYVATAEGAELRRLTESESADTGPAWSPDGERIAFTSDRSNPATHEYEIYVMDADGGDVQRLTTNDVWDLEPAWR